MVHGLHQSQVSSVFAGGQMGQRTHLRMSSRPLTPSGVTDLPAIDRTTVTCRTLSQKTDCSHYYVRSVDLAIFSIHLPTYLTKYRIWFQE
jgi:hypothetical protein